MNLYGDRTTTLVKGEGVYLWDDQGTRYLDALSGIAVCGLGYNYPAVTRAICEQAERLIHCSNLYRIEAQVQLAELLCDISGMNNVFFSNSGAEANEAAIKIARKFGQDQGIDCPHMITAEKSFHGRTMATLSATANDKIKAGFYPLVEGFSHVAFNDIDAIKKAATDSTVAVMVEPIQGEGGINVPAENYLQELRALCDANNWLLILDEIQSGSGRTGLYFAYQHTGIMPDVVTTAKGLANGVPIGAYLAHGKAASVFQPGNHGSTFGGNPLACNAALATVKAVVGDNLMGKAAALGERMQARFKDAFANNPKVIEVRGKGMLIGIQLDRNCGDLVEKAKAKGILLNVTAGCVIRLLPPLILSESEADIIVSSVIKLVEEY